MSFDETPKPGEPEIAATMRSNATANRIPPPHVTINEIPFERIGMVRIDGGFEATLNVVSINNVRLRLRVCRISNLQRRHSV